MNKILISAAYAAFSLIGLSQPAAAASGWTNFGTISTIEQDPGDGSSVSNLVLIVVTGITTNPSGCSVATGFYFSMDTTPADVAERKKRLFAMLLSAHMASRPVRIEVTGACHSVGYAELDGVVVSN